jgi:hypothetical protein
MKEIPPLPGEESLYAQIQAVLDAAARDPKIKAILTQTAVDAEATLMKALFEFRNNGRPVGNGWTSPPNGAAWGVDYLSRAASARSDMYDNAPSTTRYIYTDFDSTGARLNSAKIHGDISQGTDAAGRRVLVVNDVQRQAPVRPE